MSSYHKPVLFHESLEALAIQPNGIYVDVTFGGGGHSRGILQQLGENGKLLAFDQDADAEANAIDDPRFMLVKQNFKYLKNFLRLHGIPAIDGLLADLGVSSHQFDVAERGFSTRFDGPLDMRMSRQQPVTAADVLAVSEEFQLRSIFRQYGEVENAH
ncbi:MAG: 16S rRNA (cytosine(1402)-N(4))-methyltransferase RsmH, partial [Bacteroidia bacterium]